MWRTFNCGIGFLLIAAPGEAAALEADLDRHDLAHWRIGEVATAVAANGSASADRPSPDACRHRDYRIAVLASGNGSNLQALIDATTAGTLAARIVGVFSDRRDAQALRRAGAAGIAAHVLLPKTFATRDAFDAALFAQVDAADPDLIVCAGYMRMIDPLQVELRRNRMINLHPSLLPAFKGCGATAGAGCRRRRTWRQRACGDGRPRRWPVIAQAPVPVLDGDTPESLAARVREREHPLLVETIRWLADGRIALRDDGVHALGERLQTPLQLAAKQPLCMMAPSPEPRASQASAQQVRRQPGNQTCR